MTDSPAAATKPLVVFVNGTFVPERDAKISVFDHAVLYGDGAFETCIAWKGRVFRLDAHLDRLFRSLAALRLDSPYPRPELRELLLETTRRNSLRDAYIKCLITRGVTAEPLLDTHGSTPGCVIFARPFLYIVKPEYIERGVTIRTSSVQRAPTNSLDPRIKSLNYLPMVLAKLEAQDAGVDDTVLLDRDGHVTDGPGYNIFCVQGALLRTPAAGALEGITRETVFELAPELDLKAEAGSVDPYDLYNADEVFLTSTAGGIIPVVKVDGRTVGAGVPGAVYRRLSRAYEQLLLLDDNVALY